MNVTIHSKSVLAAAGTLFFVFAFAGNTSAQALDKRIAGIKKFVAETNRLVEIAERPDENSSVFIVELNVNRKENPYPAVGTYTSTAKFYYTYGDREKNPYPDRLIKVAVITRRASTIENMEMFFDFGREMVLYSRNIAGEGRGVRSIYFSAGRIIRSEKNGEKAQIAGREHAGFAREALADASRLQRIFQSALD